MATGDLLYIDQTNTDFTITLASLANASSRQADMISNSSHYGAAKVSLKIRTGSVAPTSGSVVEVYLLLKDANGTPISDDLAGASDAAITINNAIFLGAMVVTATTGADYARTFDTWAAIGGPLGPNWTIAVKNSTGQALDSTAGNFLAHYAYYTPQVQS